MYWGSASMEDTANGPVVFTRMEHMEEAMK